MAESNREEIAKLELIYANNPGGRVFTHLAEAYRKAGELDRARAILENGIGRHPDYASAHVVLGRVLIDQGAPDQAAGSFRRVLELDPENRVALRTMGDLARQQRPEEALGHYRQLQTLDPSDDDLAQLITSLDEQVQQSAAAALAQESILAVEAAATEPETTHESEHPAEAAAALEGLADREPEPGVAQFQAAAMESTADWSVAEAEISEDLPGDLGELALEPSVQPALTSQEPEATPDAVEPAAAEFPISETEAVEPAVAEATEGAEAELWVPEITEPIGSLETVPAESETEGPWFSDVDLTAGPVDVPAHAPLTALEGITHEPEFSAELLQGGAGVDESPSFESLLSTSLTEHTDQGNAERDLPTETLAELYQRQGFYDRSAEIYRALLQRRPDDLRLQRRLHELEELERSAVVEPVSGLALDAPPDLAVFRAVPVDEPVSAEPDQPSAGVSQAWVEDVESAWTGGGGLAEVPDSPYAWELDQDEENDGPSLADYLSRVLAWRPSTPVPPDEPQVDIESMLLPEDELPDASVSASPDAAIALETGSWSDAEPWDQPETDTTQETDDPWGAAPVAEAEVEESRPLFGEPMAPSAEAEQPEHDPWPGLPGADSVEFEQDPWSEIAMPAPVTPPAPGAPAENAVQDAFEEWFTSSPEAPSQVSAAAVEPPTEPAPTVNPVSTSEADEDESDDDLEMFRSWLQSLKR